MKHEATEQLIQTLNGQLKELPSLTKTMIQQYQMSAIVLSVMFGILFIVSVSLTVWLAVFFYKEYIASHSKSDEAHFHCFITILAGGAINLFLLAALVSNLIHACTPISSLINSFLN